MQFRRAFRALAQLPTPAFAAVIEQQHKWEMKRFLFWHLLQAHTEFPNMYQWASLCLLAIVHYIVLAHHILSAAYKQLLPGFARKASRGIRPIAPKCVALALNDDDLDVSDLQRLGLVLDWCAGAGLQHAIVYCGRGHVKQVRSSLRFTRLHVKDEVELRMQVDNSAAAHLTVSLLSSEDSLTSLISAAADTGLNPQTSDSLHAVGDQVQTAAWLDKQMQPTGSLRSTLTEPDLMLIFGKAFTLGGYPPWPIRVTEMYHMGRLQCVSCAQLQATLQQYCSTLQRFGA